MTIKARIIGSSCSGAYYEPAGFIGDHAFDGPRRTWFETEEEAERYRETLRENLTSHIAKLQRQLEAI